MSKFYSFPEKIPKANRTLIIMYDCALYFGYRKHYDYYEEEDTEDVFVWTILRAPFKQSYGKAFLITNNDLKIPEKKLLKDIEFGSYKLSHWCYFPNIRHVKISKEEYVVPDIISEDKTVLEDENVASSVQESYWTKNAKASTSGEYEKFKEELRRNIKLANKVRKNGND